MYLVPENLQLKPLGSIHWGIAVKDEIVTSGTMVGMTADKSFSKKKEVGNIFGMTFEQIKAKQQKK